ncbi:MlaC/ttg2D family ABC transporter substrate-binding protein [Pseudooceanicola onchidii]|uniref:MlaC/ttg2D family ABC transporter substrate-binding protein n=1 Tax=Pseudooceanicola onchidii TaxID=2562279 RepID=UPI0010A9C390|nr:ABC transporter substrate-binding protein [Pseudooceanicola onchidii]
MTTRTFNNLTRRGLLTSAAAMAIVAPLPALALTDASARRLVDGIVGDINRIIASGGSLASMISSFEKIFVKYADVSIIAQSVLGPDARSASPAQMRAYIAAFQGYVARKYGKRFQEFVGGRIEVQSTRQVKTWHEVITTAYLKGQSPFEVRFLVSDRSGRELFFDMVIEGISLRTSERAEIGAMLDRNRGSIDGLIADLKKAG